MALLPVPSPRTFSVAEFETGANLNSLRDALLFTLNPPEAQLVQAVVQALANATLTAVTLDSTIVDSYGMHSNVTNNTRATAIVPGSCWVYGMVTTAASAAGSRVAQLYKNGIAIPYTQNWVINDGASPTSVSCASMVQLNTGDYVELFAYQTSGGALNTVANGSALTVDWRHA
jgi:hypothetical protein